MGKLTICSRAPDREQAVLGLEAERATSPVAAAMVPTQDGRGGAPERRAGRPSGFSSSAKFRERGQIHFSGNAAPQGLEKGASRAEAEHTVGGLDCH